MPQVLNTGYSLGKNKIFKVKNPPPMTIPLCGISGHPLSGKGGRLIFILKIREEEVICSNILNRPYYFLHGIIR